MKSRIGLLLLAVGALICVFSTMAFAAPSAGEVSRIEQPDGSIVDVVLAEDGWGDIVETLEGYVVAEGEDGVWYYVRQYDNGNPVLDSVPAHQPHPWGTVKHLRPAGEAAATQMAFAPLAPPGTRLMFNAQFRGDSLAKWRQLSGSWFLAENASGQNEFLASRGQGGLSSVIVYGKRFEDFIFSARMRLNSSLQGRPYRLVFRANRPLRGDGHFTNEYMFNCTRSGLFSVWKYRDGDVFELVPWTSSDAIRKHTKWNVLSVTAKGPLLTFFINGVQVGPVVTDSSMSVGYVGMGFYRHPDDNDTILKVDWAKLYKILPSTSSETDISLDAETLTNGLQITGGTADEAP